MSFHKGQAAWNKTNSNSICLLCNKIFHIAPSKLKDKKIKRGVFCSRDCKDNSQLGREPANKGKKGLQGTNRTSFKKGQLSWNWKNGKAGYTALHQWVKRKLGKPEICLFCSTKGNLQWANKSHQYNWSLDDWISLCNKCHGKYDSGKNRGAIKRTFWPNT